MTFLLKIKHWQLFLLVCVIPLILFLPEIKITNRVLYITIPDSFQFSLIVTSLLIFFWFMNLGNMLHKKLPPSVKMKIGSFRSLLTFCFLYLLLRSLALNWINDDPQNLDRFLLVYIGNLIYIICMVYCIWFLAKELKSVELQQSVTFTDFISEFFLIWFFPVGIWVLQPRINKLYQNSENI